ncbi:MAG: hypothetical protein A2202_00665 [Bdellovibrionales bacterium RIFOXYA1_FULL_36_14]|nr:MAG: hypothetical protein A2202_00665 [Bdellovibrionales bacterium RIFOXYA1_FULL_36_14]
MSLLYIYDDIFKQHETDDHPETKFRLDWINAGIEHCSFRDKLVIKKPIKAKREDLLRVHPESHIKRIEEASIREIKALDADTVICKNSFEVALYAAGAGILASDEIMKGNFKRAFIAARPPGHHAETNKPMGFCLFNNVAITAKYLQAKHQIKKILILDWDVHHGNGTEEIFYEDHSVYYISLHQYPHYPGTGASNENGRDTGKGYNRNFPMKIHSGDKEYLEVFNNEIVPIVQNFGPDFILISAGFDAHARDFLSGINLSSEVYGEFTKIIMESTPSFKGRIISYLEGGYEPQGLTEGVLYHMRALCN